MLLRREEVDLEQKLNKKEEFELINRIKSDYVKWDKDRATQREQSKKVDESLFCDVTKTNKTNNEQILLPQVYEQFQTLKASIWKSNFSNYDMMFNVQGKTEKDQMVATIQKASIKNTYREMKLNVELREGLEHYLRKGEMILFTGWETSVEGIRRKEEVEEPISDPYTGMQMGSKIVQKIVIKDKIKYDGPKVTSVDPFKIVWDKTKEADWDSCPKITRSLSTIEVISENEVYSQRLTPQIEKELRAMIKDNDTDESNGYSAQYGYNTTDEADTMGIEGDQIEILEMWGDIVLPNNGVVLKNHVVTLAARKYILGIESNPYIHNPFIMHKYMADPETGRGISPLLVAVPLNQISSQILNGQLRALKLTLNPPHIAPMGMFTQNFIDMYPGKIVEYNDLFTDKYPQPIEFKNAMMGFDFLQLLESKIESATGAFKYMTGAQDSRTRTATETSALVTGQNTRLSMTVAFMNIEVVIPMTEKVAKMMANFNFKDKEIRTSDQKGNPSYVNVTPEIMQGEYDYIYGDSQAVVEMEAKMKKIADMLAPFADKVPIDWNEFLRMMMQKMNVEDAERILQADPIDEMLKGMPPEMRDMIKKQIVASGQVQIMIGQMSQQQGGGGGMPQAPQGQPATQGEVNAPNISAGPPNPMGVQNATVE